MNDMNNDGHNDGRTTDRLTDRGSLRTLPRADAAALPQRKTFASSLHAFFAKGEREVWVQNQGKTQISIDIERENGPPTSVLIPLMREPICITDVVGFKQLSGSNNFKRIASHKDKILKLLEADEAYAWFEDQARKLGLPNAEAAYDRAYQKLVKFWTREQVENNDMQAALPPGQFAPPKSAQELMGMQQPAQVSAGGTLQQQAKQAAANAGFATGEMYQGEEASARVVQLAHEASMAVPAPDRMDADTLQRELDLMEGTLSMADLQHIESFVPYRSVKTWARLQAAALGAEAPG